MTILHQGNNVQIAFNMYDDFTEQLTELEDYTVSFVQEKRTVFCKGKDVSKLIKQTFDSLKEALNTVDFYAIQRYDDNTTLELENGNIYVIEIKFVGTLIVFDIGFDFKV